MYIYFAELVFLKIGCGVNLGLASKGWGIKQPL